VFRRYGITTELRCPPRRDGSRAGATTGNRWQNGAAPNTAETGETVAVGCDRLPPRFMVRRRSTVRVRQRALAEKKAPVNRIFCCLARHHRAPPHDRWDRCELTSRRQCACKSAHLRTQRSTSLVRRDAAIRDGHGATPDRLDQALLLPVRRRTSLSPRRRGQFMGTSSRQSACG
jgi:hypothetical protein